MINEVLTILKNQLNSSEGLQDVLGDIAVIDDIAKHDDDTSGLDNKVVITLLNPSLPHDCIVWFRKL